MIWVKLEPSNADVTNTYLETIGKAFEENNKEVRYVNTIKDIRYNKGDYVVVDNAVEAMNALIKHYKIIYWAQGAWPEESFMKNRSRLKYWVAGLLERISLKKSCFTFFVSNHMKEHYEKKYKIDFKDNYYVMPCMNDCIHKEAFFFDGKYDNNTFCYIGSTSVWQCFDETLKLYSEIEKKYVDTNIILLVKEKELALSSIQKYGIKNYKIDYVPVNELGKYLEKAKYGFVLRKNSVVNNVATPTKIQTYLAYGILPIYSSCLLGINDILRKTRFAYPYDGEELNVDFIFRNSFESMEVYEDFEKIFSEFYDRKNHIEKLKKILLHKF